MKEITDERLAELKEGRGRKQIPNRNSRKISIEQTKLLPSRNIHGNVNFIQ